MEAEEFVADPDQLRAEAQKETRRRGLDDYSEAIRVLKEEKGFSFREIAAWLREHGLKVDHNGVWRTYFKVVRSGQGGSISERIERFERKQVRDDAMPWMKES